MNVVKAGTFDKFMVFLVVLGGLNWGFVGAFNFDLVAFLLGTVPVVQQIVYVVIGVAALYMLYVAYVKK